MAQAEQQDENYWPGFVDALSTIVMVVTFLLIILAVAIFVMSLNIARVSGSNASQESTTNISTDVVVPVVADAASEADATDAIMIERSSKSLRLQFDGISVSIDEAARGSVATFFADGVSTEGAVMTVTAYFDPAGAGYTKKQRMGYYRAMAVRNILIEQGFSGSAVKVLVKEASSDKKIDTVEVTRGA